MSSFSVFHMYMCDGLTTQNRFIPMWEFIPGRNRFSALRGHWPPTMLCGISLVSISMSDGTASMSTLLTKHDAVISHDMFMEYVCTAE